MIGLRRDLPDRPWRDRRGAEVRRFLRSVRQRIERDELRPGRIDSGRGNLIAGKGLPRARIDDRKWQPAEVAGALRIRRHVREPRRRRPIARPLDADEVEALESAEWAADRAASLMPTTKRLGLGGKIERSARLECPVAKIFVN